MLKFNLEIRKYKFVLNEFLSWVQDHLSSNNFAINDSNQDDLDEIIKIIDDIYLKINIK